MSQRELTFVIEKKNLNIVEDNSDVMIISYLSDPIPPEVVESITDRDPVAEVVFEMMLFKLAGYLVLKDAIR